MPAHIPIILNFSGKVNGKRVRSIGKFFCEQIPSGKIFSGGRLSLSQTKNKTYFPVAGSVIAVVPKS